MITDEHGLNDRQRRFASLIVKGLSAKDAYRKSFPRCRTVKTAEVEGCSLLKNPKVEAYIKELRANDNEKLALDRIITKQETLEFLTQVIRTAAGDINKHDQLCQSYKDTTGEAGHRIDEIKLPDKLRAAERVCKMLGWDAPIKTEEEVKFQAPSAEENQSGLNILARWANFAPRRIQGTEAK